MDMDSPSSCLNPSSHTFQQQQQQHQLHLQSQQQISDPHAHDDDFLDQMLLSTLPSSSWSESEMISPAAACPSPQTHRCCFNFDVAPQESAAVYASEIVHEQIAGGMSPPVAMKPALLLHHPSPFRLTDSLLFTDHQSQNLAHPHQDVQSLGGAHATAAAMDKFAAAVGTGNSGRGGALDQTRQRVRARRGQATDPHSIAERLRRERIAERMKGLQELVPNANKTDKASMLDEIIEYVKFLQLQVKVLSMSRMSGAAAVAPPVADISTEAKGGGQRVTSKGVQGSTARTNDGDVLAVAEQHVVKMMEEDMGSAMQYLLGKGLCLMPISLATAISSSRSYPLRHPSAATDGPSSPSVSALTVQSAADPSTSVSMC